MGKKSNDTIPDDELFLAELIQNAAANGLVSTRHSRYVSPDGERAYSAADIVSVYGCCARGAAQLSPDTIEKSYKYNDIETGNDFDDDRLLPLSSSVDFSGVTIGCAFEQALRLDQNYPNLPRR